MTEDRLRRLESLFHGALAQPPLCRDEYVEKMCGGDEGLKRDVQSLLAHENHADDFLESPPPPPVPVSGRMSRGRSGRWNAGDRVGHYVIDEPLGAGGMGEVYRARDTILARD